MKNTTQNHESDVELEYDSEAEMAARMECDAGAHAEEA
jgi:hypothetical protein